MNYEKAYKESLERARDYYKVNIKLDKADENLVLEDIFPELVESGDEKIRKHIISVLEDCWQTCKNIDYDSSRIQEDIAWLEKQGTVIKDTISMDVNSETEWDDIHKFLRMNLDGEKVKLLIIREE